ncbi:MAG: DUF5615 family PIN-like protein [Verrucomicrobia bacterium]|nr:DUF5615 family PIN-like protein [Verrucomicrobiota bacterium]MCH8514265.1 DUF5615 family PIN-like protein [Kiritimatiellia bacterium]
MARILLDSCVWGGCIESLRASGHDVDWCGLWEQDPGDAQILAKAYSEGRILFTMDKDFGELAILKGLPHSGLVRLQGFTSRELAHTIHTILLSHESHLVKGALIVATPKKLRIRTP